MQIPKCWKSIKSASRRPCLSSALTWRTINLCTSKVANTCPTDAWKTFCNIHETKSLSNILFIRHKFFTCNEALICWTMSTRSKRLWINSCVWRYHAGGRHRYDIAREFAGIVRVLDHCLRHDATEGLDDGVRVGMFDVQDVKTQWEWAPRRRHNNDVASKQSGRSTFMSRRKDVLLLWETGPHCTVLL